MPDFIKRFLPFISLIVLCLIVAVLEPRFLSPGNLASVVRQTTPITVMAIGMTMVMVSGGIDLSVGSLLALAGVCGALTMTTRPDSLGVVLAGLVVCVAVGLLGGFLNGLAVTTLKIPPFIVTLGALGIYRGIALLITGGNGVVNLPESFGKLAEGAVIGIPTPLLIVVAVALIVHFMLTSTQPGRYCYAIGSNIEAARYAGIRVTRYQILFYCILGALTGLAGAIVTARLVNGVPTEGEGHELNVIAAVVIGGGSLSGGQGTVIGTIIGSLIMGVLSNGANLLGISNFIQKIVIGSVIVLAVTFDEFQRRKFEIAD
jgi:ribose transport system permease protein